MKYRVSHVTRYEYELPVLHARHWTHLRPRPFERQRVLDFHWHAGPSGVSRYTEEDYFGNTTDTAEIAEVHDLFEVRVQSHVEVESPNQERLQFSPDTSWDSWVERLRRDPTQSRVRGYTFDSPLVRRERALGAYVEPIFGKGRSAMDAVEELCHRIHEDFTYDPTVTTAATPLSRVLAARRGVCQDFAHVAIGALRAAGLPARYVSGYLETRPPPGRPKLRGADASHAWASVLLPEVGWVDFDPTNDVMVEDRHITLGWGRDFSDVSPLKGVVLGGGNHRVAVEVDVEPA